MNFKSYMDNVLLLECGSFSNFLELSCLLTLVLDRDTYILYEQKEILTLKK